MDNRNCAQILTGGKAEEQKEMSLTEEQYQVLSRAAGLLADVQIELLKADEKLPRENRTEGWRMLYRLRCELGQYMFDHRPEAGAQKGDSQNDS